MVLSNERSKGMIGYIIAILLANIINIVLSKVSTLTIEQTTFISVYVLANIIIYSCDILFAKELFFYKGVYGPIPYTDLVSRGDWLIHSLYDKYFFRFLITVVIDTIIGITLLKYIIQVADRLNILTKWKYRNYLLVFIIAIFTYILYLGTLRFNWAYSYQENELMNILVVIWASLAILIVSTSNYSTINNTDTVKWRNLY